jgi:hypothetical protein
MGNRFADGVDRSCGSFAQQCFELGKDLLDRIEIGRLFGQEDEMGACRADRLPYRFAFMRSKIVEHDDIVRLQGRDEELLDISPEALAIDGAVE